MRGERFKFFYILLPTLSKQNKKENPAKSIDLNGVNERRKKWWYHQESNRGHTDFQSDALPTELWHHVKINTFSKVITSVISLAAAKVIKKL